jgi:hypothetical protein
MFFRFCVIGDGSEEEVAAGLMKWPFIRITLSNPKLKPITAATAASLGSPLVRQQSPGAEAAGGVGSGGQGDGGKGATELPPALCDGLGAFGRTMQDLKVPMLLKLVL